MYAIHLFVYFVDRAGWEKVDNLSLAVLLNVEKKPVTG
jgi:hypothetical protein